MKPKKSKKANLEKFRTIFFQVGMILTLSAILVAFEWTSGYEYKDFDYDNVGTNIIEEIIPITREKEKIEPIKPPTPVEKFTIEDNDVVIEDEPFFIDTEDNGPDPFADMVFNDDYDEIDEPVLIAQFMPTFQGKDGLYFRNYVANNVRFPEDAIRNSISGTVYMSFVIDKDGSVTNVKVLRSVHPVIDKAVLKVIENSPKWEPGLNNGKYVRVQYSIAIAFQLQ